MGIPGYKLLDPERTAYWRTCKCSPAAAELRGPVPPAPLPPTERIITEGGFVLNVCSRCRGLRSDG